MEHTPHLTTRVTLTRELIKLREGVDGCGESCHQAVSIAVSSLTISSDVLMRKVDELALKIVASADSLENDCLSVLSLQQPLLGDLRFVVGTLRISAHLSRLASFSQRLVSASNAISEKNIIPPELVVLAENCAMILRDLLAAFKHRSVELSLKLVRQDKENDLLHDSSLQKVIRRITADDTTMLAADTHLLTIVRLLERIGDALASVAREIYFIHSGKKL